MRKIFGELLTRTESKIVCDVECFNCGKTPKDETSCSTHISIYIDSLIEDGWDFVRGIVPTVFTCPDCSEGKCPTCHKPGYDKS